jgi:hypothetical protein
MTGNSLMKGTLLILLPFNRPWLNEEPLEIRRGEFLPVRIDQHVPSTLVG